MCVRERMGEVRVCVRQREGERGERERPLTLLGIEELLKTSGICWSRDQVSVGKGLA